MRFAQRLLAVLPFFFFFFCTVFRNRYSLLLSIRVPFRNLEESVASSPQRRICEAFRA